MALSAEQRSLRARVGAHAVHAKYGGAELTANARAKFIQRFLDEVDEATPGLDDAERLRRASHLLSAYMAKLSLRSSIARSKKAAAP